MPRIPPLDPSDLPQFAGLMQLVEATMGFVPTSLFTMGRLPDMVPAFAALNAAVFLQGQVEQPLKRLVAHMASVGAGCRYCQAHTAAHAAHLGVAPEKIEALWEFETSPLFEERERAALRLALAGGKAPAQVTDAHFTALREHFSDDEIAELVAAIAVFGFLNRWNDILATELEAAPLQFARAHLGPAGWKPGPHAR